MIDDSAFEADRRFGRDRNSLPSSPWLAVCEGWFGLGRT